METPGERCQRLVGTLEEFIVSESLLLRAKNFPEALAVQERAGHVVTELAEFGASADEFTRQRVFGLLKQRHATQHWLTQEIAEIDSRLKSLDLTQVRITRLRPVYAGECGPTESWRRTA